MKAPDQNLKCHLNFKKVTERNQGQKLHNVTDIRVNGIEVMFYLALRWDLF